MKGSTIKQKIIDKGFSLSDVADLLGVTKQNFYTIAVNNDNVKTETLERIAAAIGEPVSYFYNEYPIISMEDYSRIRQMEKEVQMLKERVQNQDQIINKLLSK